MIRQILEDHVVGDGSHKRVYVSRVVGGQVRRDDVGQDAHALQAIATVASTDTQLTRPAGKGPAPSALPTRNRRRQRRYARCRGRPNKRRNAMNKLVLTCSAVLSLTAPAFAAPKAKLPAAVKQELKAALKASPGYARA